MLFIYSVHKLLYRYYRGTSLSAGQMKKRTLYYLVEILILYVYCIMTLNTEGYITYCSHHFFTRPKKLKLFVRDT